MLRYYRRQKEVEKQIEAELQNSPDEPERPSKSGAPNKPGTRKPPQRKDTVFSDAGDNDFENLTPEQFQRKQAQFAEWRKDYERRKLEDAAAITKAIKDREAEKKKREQALEQLRIQKEREDEAQKRADEILLREAKERDQRAKEEAIRKQIKEDVKQEFMYEQSISKDYLDQKSHKIGKAVRALEEANVEPRQIQDFILTADAAWPAPETALVPYVKEVTPPKEPESKQPEEAKKPLSRWKT